MKRYEKLAHELMELIRTGTLQGKERLPSVRAASQRFQLSQSTVIQAYYLLEAQGLIYAKDRSGYYVTPSFNHTLKTPLPAHLPTKTTEVHVSDFIFSILQNLKHPHMVQLGSAFPAPELFPIRELSASMATSLKALEADPHALIANMTRGHPDLIRQIELRYRLNGTALMDDELIITNGAMEALSLSLQAVTKPGDIVAIESPAFYAILQILERLQLTAIEIPVHPTDGMDITALIDATKQFDIKAVVLMTHCQNPLGANLPIHAQRALMALSEQHQLPIIVDDVYLELYFGQAPPHCLKALDQSGLILHCSSFSKCLAPGYRIGWVAAGRFHGAIERLKLMTSLSPAMPSQLALAHYLQHQHYDRHLQRLRYTLALSAQKMRAAIAEHFPQQTAVSEPQGGYFLWVELPHHIDALKLYHAALAHNITLAPGSIFSVSHQFNHCIRLNYGMRWHTDLDNAIARLGKLIKNQ
ncbi:GntR family transcriptional regulator [Wohlfahrtiimonas chitiniclastica]|uniref:aminotransferase-like domain-containing protein n=1 Tax=Wohlfahrtiimonas chitiniclastica TaxID=400946 RepID=UPI000B984419|nr:PLP-dependent aminotransferase family protein [Wohlfahrtiimonas chitiniclastica]OYQ89322.1 GntR family transcriptional regulator [Wohlfahrtiimonas chitiniclastica]